MSTPNSSRRTAAHVRYISSRTSEASSLFFSSGTSFDEYQEGGLYRMTKADKRENIIMIASEPLTFERSDWMEVKTNTMLVITPKVCIIGHIILSLRVARLEAVSLITGEPPTNTHYRRVLGPAAGSSGAQPLDGFRHFHGFRWVSRSHPM